jgi:hypothetical protein
MNSMKKSAARFRDLWEARSLIWIKRRDIDGSVIVIFFARMNEPVPTGSYRKQGDSQRQARASSRKARCDKPTPSTGCVNEFAFVPLEASHPHELSRAPPRPSGEESTSQR